MWFIVVATISHEGMKQSNQLLHPELPFTMFIQQFGSQGEHNYIPGSIAKVHICCVITTSNLKSENINIPIINTMMLSKYFAKKNIS